MSRADRFTQAREAALRAAKADAARDAALRSTHVQEETTGEFSAADDIVAAPITVLSTDTELFDAVRRAVLDQHEVSRAETIDQAAEFAAAGKCALLVTDQTLTLESASAITERLRKHEPALVSIAVGARGQDGVLLGLMTANAVDRFMLKPLTPALARIVVEAASKEHQARKPRQRNQQRVPETPAFTMRRAASKPEKREDKIAITQPVRVVPATAAYASEHAPHQEEATSEIAAAPDVAGLQPAPDERPEDHTVLVPALSESPPEPANLQAQAAPGYVDIPLTDTPADDTRTVLAREQLDIEMPAQLPETATSAFQRAGIPRPPWFVLIAAMIAVGALVWWIMLQRLPEIDPRELISSNLSAAQTALQEQRYVEPSERSALHHFSTVLALDPANAQAKAGIERITDHYLAQSQALIGEGKFAEAVSALQYVRRVRPDDGRLATLEAQLRDQLAQQFPQVRKPVAVDSQSAVAVMPKPAAAPLPAPDAREASPRVARNVERPAGVREPAPVIPEPSAAPAMDGRLIADAHQAIDRGDFAVARTLIAAALEMGAAPDAIQALNQSLNSAEQIAAAQARSAPLVAAAEAAVRTAPALTPAVTAPVLPEPPALPVLVKMVQPRYPDDARMRGIEGWVDLSFVVSASGDVIDPRVEDSSMKHLFARPALSAVRQWKYQPRKVADPAQRTRARVQFKLTD